MYQLFTVTCHTERLYKGALFIGQQVWQLEAVLCWVVNKLPEDAVHGRQGKELDVGIQVVSPLPVDNTKRLLEAILCWVVRKFPEDAMHCQQ